MAPPRVTSLVVLAALVAACSGGEKELEHANALRLAGDPQGALDAYKVLLADLGEGALPERQANVRGKALRSAADVSYLELGDYTGAISYYRRVISLYPGQPEAYASRARIGDIYRDRFKDHLAAIAQYADIAGSDAPEAPRYQLEVARQYLAVRNYEQARTEARILRERWPQNALADEAQLLTGQVWTLEGRDEEALGALQALIERQPPPELAARAYEAQALIHAQAGRFERAIKLYGAALPAHPNPEAIRTALEAVRERRERAGPAADPGDRAAAFR